MTCFIVLTLHATTHVEVLLSFALHLPHLLRHAPSHTSHPSLASLLVSLSWYLKRLLLPGPTLTIICLCFSLSPALSSFVHSALVLLLIGFTVLFSSLSHPRQSSHGLLLIPSSLHMICFSSFFSSLAYFICLALVLGST